MNAILAFIFTIDKELLQFFPPLFFLAVRTLSCSVVFGTIYATTHKFSTQFTKKDLLFLLALGVFYIYITNLFLLKGLTMLSSAKASLIYNANPFIVALLSWVVFREKFSRLKIAGLAIGWLAFVPLLFFNNPGWEQESIISIGEIYVFIAASAVAISFLILQRVMYSTANNIPATMTSAVTLFTGGVLSLIHSYATEMTDPDAVFIFDSYSIGLLGILIASTLAWSFLNSYLTQYYKASFLSLAGFTAPLFAAIFEPFFFNSTVGWNFYVSLACVATGLYLSYRSEQKITQNA
jgi:drug/metabolite transporter (DMT)-like permease